MVINLPHLIILLQESIKFANYKSTPQTEVLVHNIVTNKAFNLNIKKLQ